MPVREAIAAAVGYWGHDSRSMAERLRDYDWDGGPLPACAAVAEALADQSEIVSEAFWTHYLSLEATRPVRHF